MPVAVLKKMERWCLFLPKTLKECLAIIGLECEEDREIHQITNDSRLCDEHTIYCGNDYQEDAYSRHAYVVAKKYLSRLMIYFYDDPSKAYFVIGVTGTNGKTSMTSYLKQALTSYGYRCIRLGSHKNEFEDNDEESVNTTMNVMKNLEIFLNYKDRIDCIIMEVSSHAIEENRIAFIRFDRIFYTNITPEHLDYHLTFTHYKYSKFKLRNYLKENGKILIHYDHRLLHELIQSNRNILTYGHVGRYQVTRIVSTLKGSDFDVNQRHYHTTLIGPHQVMNLAGVIACLESMKCMDNVKIIEKISGFEGRMEYLNHSGVHIIIDYAHTSDALEEVCTFLVKQKEGKLVIVFGCGGERDKQKRSMMALVASEYGQVVIVSEDNNRNETFDSIVNDMKLERFSNVRVMKERKKAVQLAFHICKERDIILLAGKGSEQFLVANGIKSPYNDKECILQCERG